MFAEEAQRCRRQCFLGELARLHWKRYPSVQALLSDAALVEINSMALLLTDNTALLEAEHAGGKRSARSREDTHLERIMDSSALRLVKQLVADGKQWHQDVLAAEDARKDPPKQGNAVSLAVDRRRARPGKQNARSQVSSTSKKKKQRKLDTNRLWMRADVSGRRAVSEDHANYMRDMRDPKLKAYYRVLAENLNVHRGRVAKRKRSSDRSLELAQRRFRQAARRAGRPWDPRRTRQQLQQSTAHEQSIAVSRATQHMRQRNTDKQDELRRNRKRVSEYSQRTCSTSLQELGFSQDICKALVPMPLGGDVACLWCPPGCHWKRE